MTFDEWYSMQRHQLSNEQVCRMIWNAAAKAERERCAKLAEMGICESEPGPYNNACRNVAAAIRNG